MRDVFRDSVEYESITSGRPVAHAGGVIDYHVNILKSQDPVVQDPAEFDYRAEPYYMHVDHVNEVLTTTTYGGEYASWIKGVVMPVAWQRQHGQERTFCSALAHFSAEIQIHEMRMLYERGMLWTARWAAGGRAD